MEDDDNGAEGVEGLDFSNFFVEMGESDLVNLLWFGNPNNYVSNYPAARFIDEARFEGEVSFMKSDRMAADVRNFMNSRGGILAVTFNQEGSIFPVGPGNLQALQELGVGVVAPVSKTLACGDVGIGAMASVADIVASTLRCGRNEGELDDDTSLGE